MGEFNEFFTILYKDLATGVIKPYLNDDGGLYLSISWAGASKKCKELEKNNEGEFKKRQYVIHAVDVTRDFFKN